MPSFPEYLYKLTARDEQVTPLEIFSVFDTDSVALAQITLLSPYVVPEGKILILNNVDYEVDAGGAQFPLNAGLTYFPPRQSGSAGNLASVNFDAMLSTPCKESIQCDIALPGGSSLLGVANFSAGGIANTFSISLYGILIPRGNFAV